MEKGQDRTEAHEHEHTHAHTHTSTTHIRFVSQDNEFGGGGKGPDSEGGTQRYGGTGAYGEWAVDEDVKNFDAIKTWNGPYGVWFLFVSRFLQDSYECKKTQTDKITDIHRIFGLCLHFLSPCPHSLH
jgi:hypothetical protein